LDQALVSGTNFLTVVIIGQHCRQSELGVYALAISAVFLCIAAQAAIIASPLTVFSHRLPARARRRYLGNCLLQSGMLAAMFTATALGVSLVIGLAHRHVALALALAIAPLLLREFARRVAFADLRFAGATLLDGGVALAQLGVLLVLARRQLLSPVSALGAMGATTGVAATLSLWLMRADFAPRFSRLRCDIRRNWSFGRWALADRISAVLRMHASPWILTWLMDPAAAGVYAACLSISLMLNPLTMGLSNWWGPRAAGTFAREGSVALSRLLHKVTLRLLLVVVAISGGLVFQGGALIEWLYAGRYQDVHLPVALLALASAAAALDMTAHCSLSAMTRPDASFRASLWGLCTLLVLSVPLVMKWQVVGAALSVLLSAVVMLAIKRVTLHRTLAARSALEVC